MLVDDESLIIESIRGKINWKELNAVFAGQAANGSEALKKIKQIKPDILIVDVKMPKMDGIQLIGELRKLNNKAKIIISSAYADFEYAKAAISYGVEEYLIKPLKKDELNLALQRAAEQIEITNYGREEALFKLLSSEKKDTNFLIKQLKALSFCFHRCYGVILLNLFGLKNFCGYTRVDDNYLMKFKDDIIDFLNEKETCSEVIVNNLNHNEVIIVTGVDIVSKYESMNKVRKLAKGIHDKYFNGSLKGSIGIGNICNNIKEIGRSYNSACKAVAEGNLLVTQVYEPLEKPREVFFNVGKKINIDSRNKLQLFLEKGDRESVIKQIDGIFNTFVEANYLTKDILASILYDTIDVFKGCIMKRFSGQYDENEWDKLFGNILSDIYDMGNINLIKTVLLDNLGKYIDEMALNNLESSRRIIYEIKQYIDNNYSNEIKLKDIASKYLFSEQYLSRLFKDELKTSFIEYLTNIRMRKAKELLKDKDFKIKDVSTLVGYNDTKYFYKLFKKTFGITPSMVRQIE
jgi:two-component system response regulator YesN